MANNLNTAISEFLINQVRLDNDRTKVAKGSKGWLIEEIKKFPDDNNFPTLHPDIFIEYGSFSRKTKIRPLDDIDIMIILHGQGATYDEYTGYCSITNTHNSTHFNGLCFDGSSQLNSIKVINKFKEYLSNIPQYKKADIKRNQEAVTLELQSYEWVYDIVPCFITTVDWSGRTYYLIPDGNGNWKKTDPRIDHQRVVSINASNEVSVIDVIRLVKYWNKRATMPSMKSYLLENIVLNYFNTGTHTKYIDLETRDIFSYIATAIFGSVIDPKGIQGDLNTLTWDERNKISQRALLDYSRAKDARSYEQNNQMKEAINKWREIFGDDFPTYQA